MQLGIIYRLKLFKITKSNKKLGAKFSYLVGSGILENFGTFKKFFLEKKFCNKKSPIINKFNATGPDRKFEMEVDLSFPFHPKSTRGSLGPQDFRVLRGTARAIFCEGDVASANSRKK